MIPYSTQTIDEKDIRAVTNALKSGWLTQGPAIERFEKALAKKAGATYAVVLNSGTAALHAAYFAAGIGKGDEVIVPALTFAATANAALYLGAKPIFADVDPRSGTMSVADTRKKITKKTKALVPVDYAGRPSDMKEFRALARKHKLVLIEDAAQSLGGTYHDKPVGALADMTTFSFHPVKSITTGEGGAVVTNDAHYAERLRLFRSHGITKDPKLLVRAHEGPWYMEMHELGFNYRMTELSAALGESQLKRLDEFIRKRRAMAKRYGRLLRSIPGLTLPLSERSNERSAWHLYVIHVAAAKRKAAFERLRELGIGVQVHHIPVHLHPYYQKLGYKKGSCPHAEQFYATAISIPLFPRLTIKQQVFVAKAILSVWKALNR